MKIERSRTAATLLLLTALLASAPLAAGPVDTQSDPTLETSIPQEPAGGGSESSDVDLGPVTDPDGLATGSPTPDGGASSWLTWLQSLLGAFLRGI